MILYAKWREEEDGSEDEDSEDGDDSDSSASSSSGSRSSGSQSGSAGTVLAAALGTLQNAQTASYSTVNGSWGSDRSGFTYTLDDGHAVTSGWAYIGTSAGPTWYYFDQTGHAVNGWYQDGAGRQFYIVPRTAASEGGMVTGWNWITGADGVRRCYYFEPQLSSSQGMLYRSGRTPDGFEVDANGAWTVNGVVQTR